MEEFFGNKKAACERGGRGEFKLRPGKLEHLAIGCLRAGSFARFALQGRSEGIFEKASQRSALSYGP